VTGSTASLHVTGVAVGGDGVARDLDGRVVLVSGALPGEVVEARVVAERKAHALAVATAVLDPAPERIAPPCPFVAAGCGGCGWQHVTPAGQRALKARMAADALRRLGGIDAPVVDEGPVLPASGYRTTIRGVADTAGRVALRRHHSHELVAVPACQVAHPLVAGVLGAGRFPPTAEVTVRAGVRTGERLVVVDLAGPDGDEGDGADELDASVPPGVRVVGGRQLAAGKRAWIHEEAHGVRLRVSARSFFQSGPAGAEALVAAVGDALGDALDGAPGDRGDGGRSPHLLDLYGGVGLFGATLGRAGPRVTVVEASASSCADARVNLAGLDARVVRSDVGRWRPRRADAVVADPPRAGLGRAGVRVIAGTHAPRVVLVSCDAGALGRDAGLLTRAGYRLASATLVDQFVGTPHVEVVTRFDRA
jgi:23S rRNA (uracil1939-C5)-methyltransferase